ncbi:glycine--tRNA ligase subunit beta [Candidatus Methylospira mobilis]|uniref:glycine--tRNA ligase subunit beta n=1 Tax=Candidatus Methylospira mobilis TaxID=1808979 RepID=UPI0028E534BC|nr:glycine--tRNA ligase subunit beta [Candidatus Methylospira mobilis]WNV03073.1 glycine--tRNA ligase subunit beta [Candidatus Methylospira mobilis]
MAETRDLLFELGTEELPPKSLSTLIDALQSGVESGLQKAGLSHGIITAYATPRRLALLIRDLPLAQPDQQIEKRGPAVNAAYNADGSPSKATAGFLRSCNATINQLITLSTDRGEWLCFRELIKGAEARTLIPDIVSSALANLPIAKRMRWGSGNAEFVRPVHWVMLLLGNDVIDAEILGITAGRATRGHRFHHPEALLISEPAAYEETLDSQGRIIASFAERKLKIQALAEQSAQAVQGIAHIEPDLLDEVAALVEWPVPVRGHFDPRYLTLPAEVLITTMQENQKYFPVEDGGGKLLPYFITFSNIDSSNPDTVRQGNERVVRPRLSDAEFFWTQDRKQRLQERLGHLKQVTFQQKLGSLHDKTLRTANLGKTIAELLEQETAHVQRAALLSKTDLLTEMVGEFPNLQGTMGRYYALADGEDAEVATAIEEQYLPKVSGGVIPSTATGQILALADKLDTLSGIFSTGMVPTGDKDPYALRRAALGIVRIMIEAGLELDLPALISSALAQHTHSFDHATVQKQLEAFVLERLRGYLLDQGTRYDEFEAVLASQPQLLTDFELRLKAVAEFRTLPEAESLAAANKRIRNILRKNENEPSEAPQAAALSETAEIALLKAAESAQQELAPLIRQRDYTAALRRLAALRDPVDTFFNDVIVMSEDAALRKQRLGLLTLIEGLFMQIADISYLQ